MASAETDEIGTLQAKSKLQTTWLRSTKPCHFCRASECFGTCKLAAGMPAAWLLIILGAREWEESFTLTLAGAGEQFEVIGAAV